MQGKLIEQKEESVKDATTEQRKLDEKLNAFIANSKETFKNLPITEVKISKGIIKYKVIQISLS